MAQLAVATPRRISPLVVLLCVIALAGALLLGFGLRVWTEHTPKPTAPTLVSTSTDDTKPYLCRMGRAC
jgi:hypothetical protein